jgi:hypothetical protein
MGYRIYKCTSNEREWIEAKNQYIQSLKNPEDPTFQAIEKMFDNWIEKSNPAMEYKEKYFGEDAIYTKHGAIEQAIDTVFEYLDQEDLNYVEINDLGLDLIAQFEG